MATHRKPRVAIVGGGLGGTTAAILLQRAGYAVKVYEQAPSLARIGAGINLSPNVMVVMRRLGLEAQMMRIGFLPRENVQREWNNGEVTYRIPYAKMPDMYGAPHVIMHRGDLQQVLNSALEPGVLELGKRLADIDETGSTVRLRFSDGSTAEADLAIGADGIGSRVREVLLGPERPVYTGAVAYRAIFPIARLGDLTVDDSCKWWRRDSYIMSYFLTRARDEIYFVTGNPEPNWPSDDYTPVAADVNELRAAFEGYHPDVQRLVAACPGALKWPVLFREPTPLWSRGRIVLLGDSCHPMKPHMGQGAAMAMEDAAMLVRCLEHHHGEDCADAFSLYEANRYERTTRVKTRSDRHDWLRFGGDADWLFGYDVFNVPLASAASPSDDRSLVANV